MIRVIKSSDLIRLLKDKSVDFTAEELEKIIETELEKDESETDTELLECCLDALEELKKPAEVSKPVRSFKKLIFFAAAAAALIIVNVLAFSKVGKNSPPVVNTTVPTQLITQDVSETASQPDNSDSSDQASPTFKAPESDSLPFDLVSHLEENGFTDVVLPLAVLKSEENITVTIDGNSACFTAQSHSKSLTITITKSNTVEPEVTEENTSSETLSVKGISVVITNKNSVSTILYENGNNQYRIKLNSTLEEATAIAETLS